jgi:light-regulated signal transduction histidine kinase (bacteriophytochrome)
MTIAESIKHLPAFEGLGQSNLEPYLAAGKLTTCHVGEGSGLGSLIYRTIAERHQDDSQVSSKPGETKFSVRLPVHPATEMIRGVGL